MAANSRILYVVDKQNADGTWDGVASIWAQANSDLLNDVLLAFELHDQTGTYRLVMKTRSETLDQQVVIG